jgi:hypothetical protein
LRRHLEQIIGTSWNCTADFAKRNRESCFVFPLKNAHRTTAVPPAQSLRQQVGKSAVEGNSGELRALTHRDMCESPVSPRTQIPIVSSRASTRERTLLPGAHSLDLVTPQKGSRKTTEDGGAGTADPGRTVQRRAA